MELKSTLKGALTTGEHNLRTWTGIPIGVAVTYAAGKVMPDFAQIENQWLYPLPYCAPAALIGVAMAASRRARNAGYAVLGATLAYYGWAVISNLTSGQNKMPEGITTDPNQANVPVEGAGVQIVR